MRVMDKRCADGKRPLIRRYYKSDVDFAIPLMSCKCGDDDQPVELPVPDCDWRIELSTSSVFKTYIISRRGDKLTNCFIEPDTGRIHAVLKNHGLPAGRIRMEMMLDCPDGKYPDGFRRAACRQLLPIELTDDADCCCGSAGEIALTVPYIYYLCRCL